MARLLILFAVLSGALARSSPVEFDAQELEDLVLKLREATPAGWKVSVVRSEDEDLDIEVWREEKVQFYPITVLNDSPRLPDEPEEPNPPKKFEFNFHLMPFLTAKEFQELQKENMKIKGRLAEFTKALSDVPRHGKERAFGRDSSLGYFPETEKDKARVEEMKVFEEANPLKWLPQDFYFGKMSFGLYDPRYRSGVESKEIDEECTKTLKAILQVFEPYEEEK